MKRLFQKAGMAIVVLMSASLISLLPAGAATFVVNDTGDGGDEDTGDDICEVTDGMGDCTLRAALDQANAANTSDLITFDPTVFPPGGGTTINPGSELDVNGPVNIQGPGADSLVVDGNGSDRVFIIDHMAFDSPPGPHEISGMTITNGDGGIFVADVEDNVTLESLVIVNNVNTSGDGGGILIRGQDVEHSHVMISHCTISDNLAGDQGGGVAVDNIDETSSVTIQDSVISENEASGGGNEQGGGVALLGDESTLTIQNSMIHDNIADYDGGGVYSASGTDLTISGSMVVGNIANYGDGGGLFVYNTTVEMTEANISDSLISGNICDGEDGGGIAVDGDSDDISATMVTLTDSTVTNNETADDGGGIHSQQATVMIVGSTIANNMTGTSSSDEGGGINNEKESELIIEDSTIANNRSGGEGGGIRNDSETQGPTAIMITNSTISGNLSDDDGGGGISNEGNSDNTVTLLNVTVTENRADANFNDDGDGGGINQESGAGTFMVTNSIIANNFDFSSSPDCHTDGTGITSGGNNLIGNDEGCDDNTFSVALNDQVGTASSVIDPMLAALTPASGGDPANGVPTGYHDPLPGSPAIDMVDETIAMAPPEDQRGTPRPIGTDPDIGAIEAGCGDGVEQVGEQCDDGGESETCNANCTDASCGDGVFNPTAGEACDGGGESMSCNVDCTEVVCGDGVLNLTAGEECEDKNTEDGDGCSSTCQNEFEPSCGDNILQGGETCDDGNTVSGDGCDSTCQSEGEGAGEPAGEAEGEGDGCSLGGHGRNGSPLGLVFLLIPLLLLIRRPQHSVLKLEG